VDRRPPALPTYGGPATVTVIRGFCNLVHVGNTGAAWSMFSGASVLLAALAAATLGRDLCLASLAGPA